MDNYHIQQQKNEIPQSKYLKVFQNKELIKQHKNKHVNHKEQLKAIRKLIRYYINQHLNSQ